MVKKWFSFSEKHFVHVKIRIVGIPFNIRPFQYLSLAMQTCYEAYQVLGGGGYWPLRTKEVLTPSIDWTPPSVWLEGHMHNPQLPSDSLFAADTFLWATPSFHLYPIALRTSLKLGISAWAQMLANFLLMCLPRSCCLCLFGYSGYSIHPSTYLSVKSGWALCVRERKEGAWLLGPEWTPGQLDASVVDVLITCLLFNPGPLLALRGEHDVSGSDWLKQQLYSVV